MLIPDVRYALRLWRAHPFLTAAVIASLALGMGANTAVFSVLNALVLRSAPVRDPGTIVAIYSTSVTNPGLHGTSFQNYEELRRALPFDIAAVAPLEIGLSAGSGQPEQVSAELVSDNYFQLLGVAATRGRVFTASEAERAAASPVVVISDGLWRRRFGGRADVVGRPVSLNARPFTVLGVAPVGFASLDVMRTVDVWIPSAMHEDVLTGVQRFYFRQRSGGMFDIVGRAAPTVTARQVVSELQTQAARLARTFPADNTGLSFAVRPLREARMKPAQRETWVRAAALIAAVVGLVLSIACANVANLLLARSAARRREMSVRVAIGASRRRLIVQLLVESSMLSSAGAAIGLLVAYGSLRLVSALQPSFLPVSFVPRLDLTALAFTSSLVLVTSLVFGLVPALHTLRDDVIAGLKAGQAAPRSVSRPDFSRAVLIAQSTLATVTLVLAALFLRSLSRAQAIDPGFDASRLALVTFDLGMLRYDNTQGPDFVRRVNEGVAAIPGVLASAVSSQVVLEGPGLQSKIRVAGREAAEALSVEAQAVGLDYFQTLGIPLVEGRTFRLSDADDSELGWAIVNRTLASQLWPDRQVIGQRFEVLGIPERYMVIGTVADSKYESLGEDPRPFFYIFYNQSPGLKRLTLFVRTAGDPRASLPAIEKKIHAADPSLPLVNARTMSEVLTGSMSAPRTGSALLVVFGAIALILAVVGTYGITAFLVRQRQREIGIRLALGARRANLLLSVMRWTLVPALAGIGCGVAAVLLGGRFIATLLIGVAPGDPLSFAVATGLFAVAAAAASLLPAFGASRLEPARVLRRD
jgi:predicted permease